jgi:hypothetical protein
MTKDKVTKERLCSEERMRRKVSGIIKKDRIAVKHRETASQ